MLGGLLLVAVLMVAAVGGGDGTASSDPGSGLETSPTATTPAQVDRCIGSVTPFNGKELLPHDRSGHGVLKVENGTPHEGVAVLVRTYTGKTFRVMYVAPGSTAEMYKVNPGTYSLQFTLGTGWLQPEWRFCDLAGMTEFEEPLVFNERRVSDGLYYDEVRVTFQDVVGGNAETVDVPPSRFALPPR